MRADIIPHFIELDPVVRGRSLWSRLDRLQNRPIRDFLLATTSPISCWTLAQTDYLPLDRERLVEPPLSNGARNTRLGRLLRRLCLFGKPKPFQPGKSLADNYCRRLGCVRAYAQIDCESVQRLLWHIRNGAHLLFPDALPDSTSMGRSSSIT